MALDKVRKKVRGVAKGISAIASHVEVQKLAGADLQEAMVRVGNELVWVDKDVLERIEKYLDDPQTIEDVSKEESKNISDTIGMALEDIRKNLTLSIAAQAQLPSRVVTLIRATAVASDNQQPPNPGHAPPPKRKRIFSPENTATITGRGDQSADEQHDPEDEVEEVDIEDQGMFESDQEEEVEQVEVEQVEVEEEEVEERGRWA